MIFLLLQACTWNLSGLWGWWGVPTVTVEQSNALVTMVEVAPADQLHVHVMATLAEVDLGQGEPCRTALGRLAGSSADKLAANGMTAALTCGTKCPSDLRSHRAATSAGVMQSILEECGEDDPLFADRGDERLAFDPVFYALLRERMRRLKEGLSPEDSPEAAAAWQRWLDQRQRLADSLDKEKGSQRNR